MKIPPSSSGGSVWTNLGCACGRPWPSVARIVAGSRIKVLCGGGENWASPSMTSSWWPRTLRRERIIGLSSCPSVCPSVLYLDDDRKAQAGRPPFAREYQYWHTSKGQASRLTHWLHWRDRARNPQEKDGLYVVEVQSARGQKVHGQASQFWCVDQVPRRATPLNLQRTTFFSGSRPC